MAYILGVGFVVACCLAAIAWLVLAWNVVRVSFNLKPGIRAWAQGNPLNYLFNPEALAPAGLAARKRAGLSLLVFGCALVVGAIAGIAAKVMQP